jgi:hypothetical protein
MAQVRYDGTFTQACILSKWLFGNTIKSCVPFSINHLVCSNKQLIGTNGEI